VSGTEAVAMSGVFPTAGVEAGLFSSDFFMTVCIMIILSETGGFTEGYPFANCEFSACLRSIYRFNLCGFGFCREDTLWRRRRVNLDLATNQLRRLLGENDQVHSTLHYRTVLSQCSLP
jgi:hypothetical protein